MHFKICKVYQAIHEFELRDLNLNLHLRINLEAAFGYEDELKRRISKLEFAIEAGFEQSRQYCGDLFLIGPHLSLSACPVEHAKTPFSL